MFRVALLSVVASSLLLGGGEQSAASPRVHGERVTVHPRIVAPYDWANIRVTGLADVTAVAVRLAGATGVRGTLLPWLPLHRDGGIWAGRLPQPVFAGIYPIELRTRPARPIELDGQAYLRVYWAGTRARPLFDSPEQAAAWWVQHIGGSLVAIRRWRQTATDRRLVRLHRLFVVAYEPRSSHSSDDRLGAWITTVKEGDNGRWRVLEVGETPP